MSTYAAPVTDDLVTRLAEAIDAKADNAHAVSTMLTPSRRNGKTTLFQFLADHDPAGVSRRCEADRQIVETYRMTAEASDLHADAWMVMRAVIHYLASAYGVEV